MEIPERHDEERGCGFRKSGGIYLVSDGISMPCGKLPIKLDVCPTCRCGIKPARGWTWIDGDQFLKDKNCKQDVSLCQLCPLSKSVGRVGLLWIGGAYYERPEDWMAEAQRLGVSRRISKVPKDFKVGETLVFVAHRKVFPVECEACGGDGKIATDESRAGDVPDDVCEDCGGNGVGYKPGVFHVFRPKAIEYVTKGDETEEELEALVKRGITPVKVILPEQAPLKQTVGEMIREEINRGWD